MWIILSQTTAFTVALGENYWIAHIHDRIRQYTINIPTHFNILERVINNIVVYTIVLNRGKNKRCFMVWWI